MLQPSVTGVKASIVAAQAIDLGSIHRYACFLLDSDRGQDDVHFTVEWNEKGKKIVRRRFESQSKELGACYSPV